MKTIKKLWQGLAHSGLARGGLALGAALGVAFAADTLSITVMEIVDNAVILLIPGAMEAVSELRRQGHRLRFVTNNTTRSRATLILRKDADHSVDSVLLRKI